MKVKFLQLPLRESEWVEKIHNLKSALDRNKFGTPGTPPSWFFEDKDPAWLSRTIVQKLQGMKDLERIKNYDLSKLDKYGQQGEAAPLRDRLEGFNEYFEHLDVPEITKDPLWSKAKKLAIERLKFNQSGSPLTAKAVTDRGLAENKYDTSSGAPLFIKRKKPEAIEHAIKYSKDSIKDRLPTVLGQRASMGKTGNQARHIFMASMDVNVEGQRYQQPLQDYIRSLKLDFFLPWEGWDKVQKHISQTWSEYPNSLKFGADYTKMDQHFNKYHGLEVYDVIKHYFKPSEWDHLKTIIEYVFSMPILTGLGYVDQDHAMPSGSEWTNFLETMWNYIFTIYLELKYHLKFVLRMGIGDDQLWMILGKWNPKSIKWIIDTVCEEFDKAGLPGNPDKQEVAITHTSFLQRFLDADWSGYDGKTVAAGVYSLLRNATSQKFPEFEIRLSKEDPEWHELFPIRVIQIAENAKDHPLFKWYIRDIVAKSNPNVLEFVRKKDSEILSIYESARKVQHLVPSYVGAYSENKPLTEFVAFKELRAIA